MKRLVLLASLLSSAAWAGSDKPIMAPPPDWVKPIALPALPDKPDEAPVRILLADQQTKLEHGRVSTYIGLAMHIQTPQGLQAGNLSFPWNPETDDFTVHKLVIHREGEKIDVLAGGQTFQILRRETNLESAMLDGVLTANIQPEGLQVGDVLEYALTLSTSDPVLKGHVEQTGGTWNGVPFARAHFRAQWPSDMQVTLRQKGALPALKPVKSGGMTVVELNLDNVEPIIPPRMAPLRFAMGRGVELSDFKSWADLGALMAPLYEATAKIPAEGPLRGELEKIRAASADPVKRAEAALTLVQDRVRYVALLMGSGGLTPASAEETWARRFGDCKAKTALLLALLHELGIEAEPVAANIVLGDGIDERLPMVGLFNHVLVRARIGGRTYWMDGTRSGDTSLARLATPDFGWGLPLVAKNAALVRMLPDPLTAPEYDLAIEIDASAGLSLPAPVKGEVVLRGDDAIGTRIGLAGMAAEARDNALRDYWKDRLEDLEISKVEARFDPGNGTQSLTMTGKVKMDWSDSQYWTDWTRVGYEADFSRSEGPGADAPFSVGYPSFSRTVETIKLPPGFTASNIFRPAPIDETVAGIEYRRESGIKDDVFRIERTIRAVAPEFAAKDAPAAQKRLRELRDLAVSVRRPASYRMTSAEIDEELKIMPTTAEGFVRRGGQLVSLNRPEEARTAFESALKLEPDNDRARVGLLGVHFVQGGADGAAGYMSGIDLATVKLPDLANYMGGVHFQRGDFKAALGAYSRTIELQPGQAHPLALRAQTYRTMGQNDAALADATAALQADPKQPDLYLLRANIFRAQGRPQEGIAQVQTMLEADPTSGYAHVVASRILDAFGERERAMKEIDRAIEINPDATAFLNRAALRPRADLAGRLADIEEALKRDPEIDDGHVMKAAILKEQGDQAGAIRSYSALIEKRPGNPFLRNVRGIAYARTGDKAKADADFAEARKGANDPGSLNALCYEKATAGVALERALEECDAALAAQPDNGPILDSKAFVLLRLGRYDEAISFFDKALAKVPTLAPSLYGRAVARARKGDEEEARADRDAALRIDPKVQESYEGYGVTM